MGNHIRQRYCWVIVLLVSLEMAVFGGLLNCLNVFIIPICEDLGITRGSYAVTEIPYRVAGATATLFSVVFYRIFGYKKTTVVVLSVVMVTLVQSAMAKSLFALCVCRALLGAGYGMALTTGAVWVVKFWFARYQGTVIGLVSMFTGLGGSVMTILLTAWIESYGWRIASILSAGLVGLVALCYLLFLQDRPEDMGLKPLGYGVIYRGHKKLSPSHSWQGHSLQQWSKKPLLYVMIGFIAVSTIACYMAYSVLVPHFQDQGFPPQQAALYQSFCMLVLAGAKLLCGTVSDKFGAKVVGAICVFCCGAGHAILCFTANPAMCYLGVALIAVGLCLTAVVPPLLVPTLFGYYAADIITSILLSVLSIACIFSNLIANTVFDIFKSYTPSFGAAALVCIAMMAVYWLMFIMAGKERRKILDEEPVVHE